MSGRWTDSAIGANNALEMSLDWVNKRGWVSGHVTSKAAAQNLIDFANHMMATLPDEPIAPKEAGDLSDAPNEPRP